MIAGCHGHMNAHVGQVQTSTVRAQAAAGGRRMHGQGMPGGGPALPCAHRGDAFAFSVQAEQGGQVLPAHLGCEFWGELHGIGLLKGVVRGGGLCNGGRQKRLQKLWSHSLITHPTTNVSPAPST